ncbi:hypothetical protein JCM1393_27390 [Clostridium carnis]
MKKSTSLAIGILAIVFFIITAFINCNKIYEKQIKYEDPEKVLENFLLYFNVKEEIVKNLNYTKLVIPNEFYESISKRYRLYIDNDTYYGYLNSNLPSFIEYDIEEVKGRELEYISKKHLETYEAIKTYKNINDVRYYKVYGKGVYNRQFIKRDIKNNKLNIDSNEYVDSSLYIVIVDEGEGYVVDYYEEYGPYNIENKG